MCHDTSLPYFTTAYLSSLFRRVTVDAAGNSWESYAFKPMFLTEEERTLFARYGAEQEHTGSRITLVSYRFSQNDKFHWRSNSNGLIDGEVVFRQSQRVEGVRIHLEAAVMDCCGFLALNHTLMAFRKRGAEVSSPS